MRPNLTPAYFPNVLTMNAESGGENRVRHALNVQCAYLANLIVVEFRSRFLNTSLDAMRMGACSIARAGSASSFPLHVIGILLLCAEKQVLRVKTRPDIAMMANEQPVRDWAIHQLPRDAMRIGAISITQANRSISAACQAPRPQPASACHMDIGPEAWDISKRNATGFEWHRKTAPVDRDVADAPRHRDGHSKASEGKDLDQVRVRQPLNSITPRGVA